MSYTNKTLEELNVLDDFLMNAIVATPEIGEVFCKTVLSVLLQKKIGRIKVVSQRMIPPYTPEHRGIRMDVEVQEFEAGENAVDMATEKINEIVEQVRSLPEVRNEYMTLGDIIDCEREEAAEEAAKVAERKTLQCCILSYFKKHGDIPEELENRLGEIGEVEKLQSLYELALETKSVSEFMQFVEK